MTGENLMTCTECNGSGYFQGHGHVPGAADFAGREHDCFQAGCPYPCGRCHGRGQEPPLGENSPVVSDDAPF